MNSPTGSSKPRASNKSLLFQIVTEYDRIRDLTRIVTGDAYRPVSNSQEVQRYGLGGIDSLMATAVFCCHQAIYPSGPRTRAVKSQIILQASSNDRRGPRANSAQ